MTHEVNSMNRTEELNILFRKLNNKEQDSALMILKSLEFAQSVMRTLGNEQPCKSLER